MTGAARVLIVFGTGEGHTAKVAQALGRTLGKGGSSVDVVEARRGLVPPQAQDYDAVLVAGSVHFGHYQRDLETWVRANQAAPATGPNAFVF